MGSSLAEMYAKGVHSWWTECSTGWPNMIWLFGMPWCWAWEMFEGLKEWTIVSRNERTGPRPCHLPFLWNCGEMKWGLFLHPWCIRQESTLHTQIWSYRTKWKETVFLCFLLLISFTSKKIQLLLKIPRGEGKCSTKIVRIAILNFKIIFVLALDMSWIPPKPTIERSETVKATKI